MVADSDGQETVLDEGWCTIWQTGLNTKGFRLHLTDAGDGRYLLTNRRFIWYRSYPNGFRTTGKYARRIQFGIGLYKDNMIELKLATLGLIKMKRWPHKDSTVARFNVGSGEHERAVVCLDRTTLEPSDRHTNRLYELIKRSSQALDMTT